MSEVVEDGGPVQPYGLGVPPQGDLVLPGSVLRPSVYAEADLPWKDLHGRLFQGTGQPSLAFGLEEHVFSPAKQGIYWMTSLGTHCRGLH
jgi:hypothetical protein